MDRTWWNRLQQLYLRHREAALYGLSALFVVISYFLWFNFHAPPINSNIGFDLYPLRQVSYVTSPFDPYLWPGSYVPWTLGMPVELYYGTFYAASGGSYAVGLFAAVVVLDTGGALCLLYLATRWLRRFSIPMEYGLFATLIYAFNGYRLLNGFGTTDGYLSAGILTVGDPAILLILAFLTYLALFRGRIYLLALGAFSFFAFSNFPTASLTLLQEYPLVLVVLLAFRWAAWRGWSLREKSVALAKSAGGVALSIFVANAYLVYPLALVLGSYLSSLGASNPAYTFSYGFDTAQTVPNALRLATDWSVFSPKAPPWAVSYLNAPLAIGLAFVVPALAFLATLFLRRLGDVTLYGLMVVTAVLSASINTPFGPAFVALTTNVAPFRAFYYGATFSPLLLVFYCFFAPVTIALLPGLLRRDRGTPADDSAATSAPPSRPSVFGLARPSARRSYVWPILVAALIVAAAYPALSPNFSDAHAAAYPIDATLPGYYTDAASFLEKTDPNGPTMVFPLVQPFDSNTINGSTWYSGIDLYPNLIPNPSISSAYPSNYHGEDGNQLPVAGFVYDMGGTVCATANCTRGGVDPVPELSTLWPSPSPQFVTGNTSTIDWQASFPTDNVSLHEGNGTTSLEFRVNASVSESNGHWMLGFLPGFENLSGYEFAMINYTLTGASPSSVLFGFHSYSLYGPGDAYALSNYSELRSGAIETVLIPLADPTVPVHGVLSNVTDLFFVDDTPASTGWANLTVDSLRLLREDPFVAPVWSAGTSEDRVSLSGQPNGTALSFEVDLSEFEPNGHWALGYYGAQTDLSGFGYAVLNYTLDNLNPEYLQFGFHSGVDYGPGSGFLFSSYLTFHDGDRDVTLIPLAAPTLSIGASLTNVTNLFLTYTPPSASPGVGYLNLSSIRLAPADPDPGAALAGALARLGVEFAYVDTSVAVSNYVGYVGPYYNEVFGRSPDFAEVFHGGTITIYRDLLYSGTFGSPARIAPAAATNVTIGSLDFSWAGVYYNSTNLNLTYVPPAVATTTPDYTPATISSVTQNSATQYTLDVRSSGTSLLEMRIQYSDDWVARVTSNGSILPHFEVDGYANAWMLPPGSYALVVSIPWAPTYAGVELGTLAIPPAMFVAFLAAVIRRRSRDRRRRTGGAAVGPSETQGPPEA